jgi:hypothetical protein
MAESIDWDGWAATYTAARSARLAGRAPERPFDPPASLAQRVRRPPQEDAVWLTRALADDDHKWFVAELARRAGGVGDALFEAMLDAAVAEVNPSFNRAFVEPCVAAFGPCRVNEYLLGMVEGGTDDRMAGAANALYWAQVSLTFVGPAPAYTPEYATPESRAAFEALADVWDRRRRLFLETVVANPSVEVRRSLIPSLDLDPAAYPEGHRPLVAEAVAVARGHPDEYSRQRVEVQLGNEKLLTPLPTAGRVPADSGDAGGRNDEARSNRHGPRWMSRGTGSVVCRRASDRGPRCPPPAEADGAPNTFRPSSRLATNLQNHPAGRGAPGRGGGRWPAPDCPRSGWSCSPASARPTTP